MTFVGSLAFRSPVSDSVASWFATKKATRVHVHGWLVFFGISKAHASD